MRILSDPLPGLANELVTSANYGAALTVS